MAETADLLTVLQQIDTLRGKVCATCNHWQRREGFCPGGGVCAKGYKPHGSDDGCDDWQGKAKYNHLG